MAYAEYRCSQLVVSPGPLAFLYERSELSSSEVCNWTTQYPRFPVIHFSGGPLTHTSSCCVALEARYVVLEEPGGRDEHVPDRHDSCSVLFLCLQFVISGERFRIP